jgi:hypothetical protein
MNAVLEVKPHDISMEPQGDSTHAFAGFFGKHEMDVAARLIVSLCNRGNEWGEFMFSDVCWAGESENRSVTDLLEGFELLLESSWIKLSKGAYYVVTPEFVKRCKEESDKRGK